MPIYEYACPTCSHAFESLVIRKSDEAEIRCPRCDASDVRRQMSAPAAHAPSSGGSAPAARPARSCGPVG